MRVIWRRTVAEVFTGKGPSTKGLMGNGLARPWNLCPDNMKVVTSEIRAYMPILKVYFEEAFEQADPKN